MTLEDYTNLKFIRRGGQGEIYKADSANGPVCLKKMILEDNSSIDRFKREAALAIDHPNVIKVLDSWKQEDATGRKDHYIVMEWVDGETAAQALEGKRRFTSDELETILDEGIAGLDAAHEQGIIHRDMKPSNLMLNDKVKILDFGIMKYDGMETSTNSVALGPVWYWSPEQHDPSTRDKLTPATDRYSLGLVVYDLARGEMRNRFDHVPDVDGISRLSPSLKAKLNLLLDPVPERRYEETSTDQEGKETKSSKIFGPGKIISLGFLGVVVGAYLSVNNIDPANIGQNALGGFLYTFGGGVAGMAAALVSDFVPYKSLLSSPKKWLQSRRENKALSVEEANYIDYTDVDEIEVDDEGNVIVPEPDNSITQSIEKPIIKRLTLNKNSWVNNKEEYITSEIKNIRIIKNNDPKKYQILRSKAKPRQTPLGELADNIDENGEISGAALILASRRLNNERPVTLDDVVETEIVPYEPSLLRKVPEFVTDISLKFITGVSGVGLCSGFITSLCGTIISAANILAGDESFSKTLYITLMAYGLTTGSAGLLYATNKYFESRNRQGKVQEFWKTLDQTVLNPAEGRFKGIKQAYQKWSIDRETKKVIEGLQPLVQKIGAKVETSQDFFDYTNSIEGALKVGYEGRKIPNHVLLAVQKKYLKHKGEDIVKTFFLDDTKYDNPMEQLAIIDQVADVGGCDKTLAIKQYSNTIDWFTKNFTGEKLNFGQMRQYQDTFKFGYMNFRFLAEYIQQTSLANSEWVPMEDVIDRTPSSALFVNDDPEGLYLHKASQTVGLMRNDRTRIDVNLDVLDEIHETTQIDYGIVMKILYNSSFALGHDKFKNVGAVLAKHKNLKPSYIAQNLHKDPTEW